MTNSSNQQPSALSFQDSIFGKMVSSKSDSRYRRFGYKISFSTPMRKLKGELRRSEGSITDQMQEYRHNWLSKPSINNKEQTLTWKWLHAES
jgi:hypothetical protein